MISDAVLPEPNPALRVVARVISWPLSVLSVVAGSAWRIVGILAVFLGVPALLVVSWFGWRWLWAFASAQSQSGSETGLTLLAVWILPLVGLAALIGAIALARNGRRRGLKPGVIALGIGALLVASVGAFLAVNAVGSQSLRQGDDGVWLPWVVLGAQVLGGVAVGALVAAVWLVAGFVRGTRRPLRAAREGVTRWRDHAVGGGKYLAFISNEFPRLDGTLRKEGESHGPWHEARRRLGRSKVALYAWIGMALYLMVGILAQAGVIGGDYKEADESAVYSPPWWSATPPPAAAATPPAEAGAAEITPPAPPAEKKWFLGTDYIGHSVGSMALRGTAVALWIGTFSAVLACLIGGILGALAGYFGGWVDEAIVWLYTTVESIPEMLLILAFAYAFKTNEDIRDAYNATFLPGWGLTLGLFTIVLVLGLTFWTGVCRQVRGEFIRQRDHDYVTAAKALGVPTRRIVFRHVFPNVFHLVLISFSLLFIGAIKYEVVLTFLTVGVEPGEASWGRMISEAKLELLREPSVWWQLTAATAMLFGLVLCVNLFTDALRDALDPRTRT